MTIREQMQLLQIEDVTTPRQNLNGTITWKLPIKKYGKFIEVASFKSGYVRNNNCGYSNYQLNKCKPNCEYYKLPNGDYRKYVGKKRILIPDEQDRLQYLIDYCLKNYYVKLANEVEEANDQIKKLDDFYEASKTFSDSMYEGRDYRVKDLENKLDTIKRIADHG